MVSGGLVDGGVIYFCVFRGLLVGGVGFGIWLLGLGVAVVGVWCVFGWGGC